jgi:hypothetical protein
MSTLPMRRRPPAYSRSTDDDVRTQPATIVTKGGDGAVRRHEQWRHVEAFDAVETHEPGAGSGDVDDLGRDDRTVPRAAIHEGLAVGPQRRLVAEEAWMGAGGDHPPVCVLHVDDPVVFDAKGADASPWQHLASHGLDRIPPDFRDRHLHG